MARLQGHSREWLTVRDIAGLLHVSEETVRRWIRTGRMSGRFFGGRAGYRIERTELEAFLSSRVSAKDTAVRPRAE